MKLTITPDSYHFDEKEVPELHKMLGVIDRHTLVTPVGGDADLSLNSEGKTHNGYTYADVALIQLCGVVAPGLTQLVMDLSGQWRKPGEDARMFSSEHAIATLNKTLRLRFDHKLSGLQLVRNTLTKTIDGIVGSKYRYLANSDFLSRVDQECGSRNLKFYEACLYGRQFIVRYLNKTTIKFYVIAEENYNYGYHFANSEIGGKSVRASSLLARESTGDCALCPFTAGTGGRVVHSGKDFEKRLHALMGQITQRLPPYDTIEKFGFYLKAKSLGLGNENHEKNVRRLMQILTRRKLTQNFARRVVSSAASKGRGDEDQTIDVLPVDRRLALASRDGYDLFIALIREARKLPIDQREIAEQVAYALLAGKIDF